MEGLSNNRVDTRGGRVLRKMRVEGYRTVTKEDRFEAYRILRQYRSTFQYPLTKANMGLRSCVQTVTRRGRAPDVGQRLKQPPRIIDKLCRKPSMRLSQMEDIGGCRAILPDLATVYRVAERIRKTGRVLYEDDANEALRATGYRALHMITDYDGRRIEMQLRTAHQHQWAEHVEELDDQFGTRLKDGDGPDELMQYLVELASGFAQLDQRGRLDDGWQNHYQVVRDRAEQYMREIRGDG